MQLEHQVVVIQSERAVRLHVIAAGPKDAPLLVLLHGFPDNWRCWTAEIERYAGHFRVLAPDQRGYNLSDKPRGVRPYAVEHLVQDVAGLIAAEGRKQATIVGHDWGAMVAWCLAIKRPELVSRLVVMNVPHPAVMRRTLRADSEQLRKSSYMFLFQLPWLPEAMLSRQDFRMLARGLYAGSLRGAFPEAEVERYKNAWRRPGALTAMLNWYRAVFRHPPKLPKGARVRVPTRIIWGEDDRFLKVEMAEASLAFCDEGDVHVLKGARHWVHKDRPAEVHALLDEWLVPPTGQVVPGPR